MTYSRHLRPNCTDPEVAFYHLLKRIDPIIFEMAKKRHIFFHEALYQSLSSAIRHASQSFEYSLVASGQESNNFFLVRLQTEIDKAFDHYVKKQAQNERHCALCEAILDKPVFQSTPPSRNAHLPRPLSFPAFTENEYTLYRMHIIYGYSLSHIAKKHRVSQKTVLQWKQRTIETLSRHYMHLSCHCDKNRYH